MMASIRALMRTSIIAIVWLPFSSLLPAQSKSWQLDTADLVIVGNLELSSYFLSFDGIHMNGTILPTEVLYGPARSSERLKYNYVFPCSFMHWVFQDQPIGCDYRAVWSQWSWMKARLTEGGVWTLWRGRGASWTGRGFAPGFGETRDYAIRALSERRRRELTH